MNFAMYSASRIEFITYIIAKLLRMAFFFVFVFALFGNTREIVGYSKAEVLLFFAIMNTLDIGLQLIYRGLTQVPVTIRTGELDLVLTRPLSPFFWSAFRMFDFYDLTTIPAAVFFLAYAIHLLPFSLNAMMILQGIFFWCVSFSIALLLNILIAAAAFWLTEVENMVWLYRDLAYMSRFPPNIFPTGIRWFFTLCIPILVVTTYPTKALLGHLSSLEMGWAILLVIGLTLFTHHIWQKAIKRYTSASA